MSEVIYYRWGGISVTAQMLTTPTWSMPIFAISTLSAWRSQPNPAVNLYCWLLWISGAMILAGVPLGGLFLIALGVLLKVLYRPKIVYGVMITPHSGQARIVTFADLKSSTDFQGMLNAVVAYRLGGAEPRPLQLGATKPAAIPKITPVKGEVTKW